MEEQPPPLTPQEIAGMQEIQYGDLGQPQTVKIFGIMHLILGAYGVFSTLMAVIAMLGINPFLSMMPKSATASAQMQQQAAMQKEAMPITFVATIIGITTTAFIIAAGILMLKRRRNGLKWSNRYAWTSLFGKFLHLGATVFYTIPLTKNCLLGQQVVRQCLVQWKQL